MFEFDGMVSGPQCVNNDYMDTSDPVNDIEGDCAPTTGAFSPDGTRYYVDEDSNDTVVIFSVDAADGTLTFLYESYGDEEVDDCGPCTALNGLAVSPSHTFLYNGNNLIDVNGDDTLNTESFDESEGGNATEVKMDPAADYSVGDYLLATTVNNTDLAVYDLETESMPVEEDRVTVPDVDRDYSAGTSLYQSSSDDLSRFVVVGNNSIASYSFDGSFMLDHQLVFDNTAKDTDLDIIIDPTDDPFDVDDPMDTDETIGDIIFRGVAVEANGIGAIATWFSPDHGTSGVVVVQIDQATGEMTPVEFGNLQYPSRAILPLPDLL